MNNHFLIGLEIVITNKTTPEKTIYKLCCNVSSRDELYFLSLSLRKKEKKGNAKEIF